LAERASTSSSSAAPLSATELWGRLVSKAVGDRIAGVDVLVCSYEDLVALKREAGRPEDLRDIEQLAEARGQSPAG
jgi:hypothetical protein